MFSWGGRRGWSARCVALVLGVSVLFGLGAVVPAGPAAAESVAEELITVLEASGQLSAEQAAGLRDKAAVEREQLKREMMDEVRVQAEETFVTRDDFEDVAGGDRALVEADLAESMKIGGYVQFLASFAPNQDLGNGRKSPPSGDRDGFDTSDFRETDGFSIRRARLKLSGKVWDRTKYVIQFDADNIDNPGEEDALNVNEAYMEYHVGDALFGGGVLEDTWFRAGLFKAVTSKERITSSSKRITIARSMAVNNLGVPDRDVGFMVYNKHLFDDRVELYGGAINGMPNETEDQNDPQTWFARGQYNILSDTETRLGMADWHAGAAIWGGREGANGEVQTITADVFLNGEEGAITFGSGNRLGYSFDTGLTLGRFGLDAEVIVVDYDPKRETALIPGTTVLLTKDQQFWGFQVTPSYWLIPDTLQGVFRYEMVDYDNVMAAESWATTVGLNWHLAPKYRSVIRANWVHFNHESALTPARALDPRFDDELEQDFFLVEWQVKI